jgi:hypothetical protein
MADVDPSVLDYFSRLASRRTAGAKTKKKPTKPQERVRQSIDKFQSIGFKKSQVQRRLQHIKEKDIDDFPVDVIVTGFAHAWHHAKRNQGGDIERTLTDMALNKSTAEELAAVLRPLQGSCYTDSQLYNIGVGYLLGYYKPARGPKAKFFRSANQINTWLTEEGDHPFINIGHLCSPINAPTVKAALNTLYSANQEQSEFYYHATSWSYAASILEYIDFTRGSRCQDFGITPGFYLSDVLEHALDWGEKKSRLFKNEVAIIVFRVPQRIMKDMHYRVLDGSLWSRVVKESRLCIGTNEVAEIRGDDFLYGSMLANPSAVRDGLEEPVEHAVPKKQLVSRSRRADAFLQGCIVGCIYFQKYGGKRTIQYKKEIEI